MRTTALDYSLKVWCTQGSHGLLKMQIPSHNCLPLCKMCSAWPTLLFSCPCLNLRYSSLEGPGRISGMCIYNKHCAWFWWKGFKNHILRIMTLKGNSKWIGFVAGLMNGAIGYPDKDLCRWISRSPRFSLALTLRNSIAAAHTSVTLRGNQEAFNTEDTIVNVVGKGGSATSHSWINMPKKWAITWWRGLSSLSATNFFLVRPRYWV